MDRPAFSCLPPSSLSVHFLTTPGDPAGRPAVQRPIQDTESSAQASTVIAVGGRLLLPEQGVGDETGHLDQRVRGGAAEEGAADYPLYGYVAGAPPVLAGTMTDRHRIVVAQPAVESDRHLILATGDDNGSVDTVSGGGGVGPVEHPGPG